MSDPIRDANGKIINSLEKRIKLWETCIATAETDAMVDPTELARLREELAAMVAEQEGNQDEQS